MYYYQQNIIYINYRKNSFLMTLEKLKKSDKKLEKNEIYNIEHIKNFLDDSYQIYNILIMNQQESIIINKSVEEIKDKCPNFNLIYDFDIDDN